MTADRAGTVRLLREELQLLQEPGSYVGEVVKVMGKKKVLVKVQPEGKYGKPAYKATRSSPSGKLTRSPVLPLVLYPSRRLCAEYRYRPTHS